MPEVDFDYELPADGWRRTRSNQRDVILELGASYAVLLAAAAARGADALEERGEVNDADRAVILDDLQKILVPVTSHVPENLKERRFVVVEADWVAWAQDEIDRLRREGQDAGEVEITDDQRTTELNRLNDTLQQASAREAELNVLVEEGRQVNNELRAVLRGNEATISDLRLALQASQDRVVTQQVQLSELRAAADRERVENLHVENLRDNLDAAPPQDEPGPEPTYDDDTPIEQWPADWLLDGLDTLYATERKYERALALQLIEHRRINRA